MAWKDNERRSQARDCQVSELAISPHFGYVEEFDEGVKGMGMDGKRERTKARQPPSWSARMRDARRLLANRRARISLAVSRWTIMIRRTSSGRASSIVWMVGERTAGPDGSLMSFDRMWLRCDFQYIEYKRRRKMAVTEVFRGNRVDIYV